MREFSKREKDFIKKNVSIQNDGTANSLKELQVARLLRKQLNFFAIRWDIEPKTKVTIFKQKSQTPTDADKLYYEISDFIYFVEELVELNFIKLQHIPSDIAPIHNMLYDRERYRYDEEKNCFFEILPETEFLGKVVRPQGLVSLEGWSNFNIDFANDLERCALAIIYPLPSLRQYVDNGFKTEEQLNFAKQLRISHASFWVALVALIVTVCISKYCSQTIDESQLNSIKSAIENTEITEPITITTKDTIPVVTINQPKH